MSTINVAIYEDRIGTTVPIPALSKAPDITADELAEARRMIDAGSTLRSAAKQLGRPWDTVSNGLVRSGFDYTAFNKTRKDARNAEAIRLYDLGWPANQVSQKVGLAMPSLRKLLKEAGIYEGRKRSWTSRPEGVSIDEVLA